MTSDTIPHDLTPIDMPEDLPTQNETASCTVRIFKTCPTVFTCIWINPLGQLAEWTKYCYDTTASSIEQLFGGFFIKPFCCQQYLLKPVRLLQDPLCRQDHFLVICEVYDENCNPHSCNTRYNCINLLNQINKIWFHMTFKCIIAYKNEFSLTSYNVTESPCSIPGGVVTPFSSSKSNSSCCPNSGNTTSQPKYHWLPPCGRNVIDKCVKACIRCGIRISIHTSDLSLTTGMWVFSIGPCFGIDIADSYLAVKYIFTLICNQHNTNILFCPEKNLQPWNSSLGSISFGFCHDFTDEQFNSLFLLCKKYKYSFCSPHSLTIDIKQNILCFDPPDLCTNGISDPNSCFYLFNGCNPLIVSYGFCKPKGIDTVSNENNELNTEITIVPEHSRFLKFTLNIPKLSVLSPVYIDLYKLVSELSSVILSTGQ